MSAVKKNTRKRKVCLICKGQLTIKLIKVDGAQRRVEGLVGQASITTKSTNTAVVHCGEYLQIKVVVVVLPWIVVPASKTSGARGVDSDQVTSDLAKSLANCNAAINILNPLSFTNCKQTHWTLSIAATLVHRALPGCIDHRHRSQDSTVAPCPTVTPPSSHFRPSLLSSHQLRSPPMIRTALR
ncbi:hypothetical protein TYRP_022935 [Tyrophagus putrescentiae]|nr:hypothetical protein TYRP_022935 [Tyrophagus putrescentiae]